MTITTPFGSEIRTLGDPACKERNFNNLIAKDQEKNQQMQWSRFLSDGHSVTYWAVEGENWPDEPIKLYLERTQHNNNINQISLYNALTQHIEWNQEQIQKFVH